MKEFKILVTAEEAVNYSDFDSLYIGKKANELMKECRKIIVNQYSMIDPRFNAFALIHAVFTAGRIQGIREEREKKAEVSCHE